MASSASSSSLHDWETCKENAAPLARGRNVRSLSAAGSSGSTDKNSKAKQDQIAHYEALVENNTHADPLVPWLAYIKYYQEALPAASTMQLMERCVVKFVEAPRYQNDVRYIQVCVYYADQTSSPADVFKYLHQHKIGVQVALFWIAWAWVAEKAGDYQFCDKVLRKGIDKKAAPLSKLQQRYKQFQRRMSRHWLNQQQQDDEADGLDDDEEGENNGRRTLGGLTEDRLGRNDRRQPSRRETVAVSRQQRSGPPTFISRSGANRRQDQPQQSNAPPTASIPGTGFSVFCDNADDDGDYDLNHSTAAGAESSQRPLETEASRTKENTQTAEPWNERGGYQSQYSFTTAPSRTAPPPPAAAPIAFDIFIDEDLQVEHDAKVQEFGAKFDSGRRTLQSRKEVSEEERLVHDPLRNLKGASDKKKSSSNKGGGSVKDGKNITCGFQKSLIAKDASGHECCFEEGRAKARHYTLVTVSTNLLRVIAVDTSGMEESDDDTTRSLANLSQNSTRSLGNISSSSRRVLFGASSGAIQLNASIDSSTVASIGPEATINTKLALKELSVMFSSPACMERDYLVEEDVVQGIIPDDAACGVNNSIVVHEEEEAAGGGFAIYCDENAQPDSSFDQERKRPASKGGFAIFQDDAEPIKRGPLFQLHQDDGDEFQGDDGGAGDTATLSLFGEALQTLNDMADM